MQPKHGYRYFPMIFGHEIGFEILELATSHFYLCQYNYHQNIPQNIKEID